MIVPHPASNHPENLDLVGPPSKQKETMQNQYFKSSVFWETCSSLIRVELIKINCIVKSSIGLPSQTHLGVLAGSSHHLGQTGNS